jgi:hypothetical protein
MRTKKVVTTEENGDRLLFREAPARKSSLSPFASEPAPQQRCQRAVRLFAACLLASFAAAAGFAAWAKREPDRLLAHLERRARLEPLDLLEQRSGRTGIVLEEDGQRVVWDGLGVTPLAQWVARAGPVTVYRFDEELRAHAKSVTNEVKNLRASGYESSELIARAVRLGAGITLCHPQTVLDVDHGRPTERVLPPDLHCSPRLRPLHP